jgi:hypothetical protein
VCSRRSFDKPSWAVGNCGRHTGREYGRSVRSG